MPKLKSHTGAKKRFFKTASGKFKCKKSGLRHLLTPSRSKRGRQVRRPAYVTKTEERMLAQRLPYA
jgi:large subunit ribosomal protein L35